MSVSCQLIRSSLNDCVCSDPEYLTQAVITSGVQRVCDASRITEAVDVATQAAFRKYADSYGGIGARIGGGMFLFAIGALIVFLTSGPLNIIIALTIIGAVGAAILLKNAGVYAIYLWEKSSVEHQLAQKAARDPEWFESLPLVLANTFEHGPW
jgi:hypothetical protein